MEILRYPNSFLRTDTEEVKKEQIKTQEFRKNCWEMIKTMHASRGVGLAATQVGWDARVFVMHNSDGKNRIVINPSFFPIGNNKKQVMEGCLSFPDKIRRIERFNSVRLIYTDIVGATRHEVFDGFDAQIVQHETEHLSGMLFIDLNGEDFRRNENA